jgi:phage shock protein A
VQIAELLRQQAEVTDALEQTRAELKEQAQRAKLDLEQAHEQLRQQEADLSALQAQLTQRNQVRATDTHLPLAYSLFSLGGRCLLNGSLAVNASS